MWNPSVHLSWLNLKPKLDHNRIFLNLYSKVCVVSKTKLFVLHIPQPRITVTLQSRPHASLCQNNEIYEEPVLDTPFGYSVCQVICQLGLLFVTAVSLMRNEIICGNGVLRS